MNAQQIIKGILMLALFGLVAILGARVITKVGAKAAAASPI